jgi:hypothetical protein
MKLVCFLVLTFLCTNLQAQTTGLSLLQRVRQAVFPTKDSILTQSVQGKVFDKQTLQPLPRANIMLLHESAAARGTTSDTTGNFTFNNVKVDRYTMKVSYVGYKEIVSTILIDASRQLISDVPMEVAPFYLTELKIHSLDEIAPVGANLINADELNRHAGNRGEAIRKVAVLPGIQNADDSRNDIIIRGNSPQSVLWRVEGINIPNPNHFSIPGTSGGPVSLINDRMLAGSAFYSGAFSAAFGNTTSGIFDLQFRNGSNKANHSTFQLGLLGAEVSNEGPLSEARKSSYLFSIRQSTIGIFEAMNINLGTDAIPRYTDASFKLNFPFDNGATLSFFGMGGYSKIDILISQQDDPSKNLYGEKDRDQYFKSATGVLGTSYKKTFKGSGFLSATLAVSSGRVVSHHDFVNPPDIREALIAYDSLPDNPFPAILDYRFQETRLSGRINFIKKVNQKNHLQVGFSADQYFLHYLDSSRNTHLSDSSFGEWRRRWQANDQPILFQPFVEWKHISNKFDLVAGIHGQYFSLTQSAALEPRLGIRYYLNKTVKLNGGLGLHSQIQQPYLYFYGEENDPEKRPIPLNKHMGLTRGAHSVVGIEKFFGADTLGTRVKLEIYYQYLYNVPVEKDTSSFSLINTGADFTRLTPNRLVNGGTARNYGFEVTVERPFAKGYLLLFTGSLFQSKYKGSDNILRNSDFNGHYIANLLFTREWTFKKQNIFSVGTKFVTTGGRWYGPPDQEKSDEEKQVVYISESKNTLQFPAYFRFDLRVSYKVNLPSITHEFAVDLINVFNTKNVLKEAYIPGNTQDDGEIVTEYQLGTLPFFYYRISI